jgi:TonB-linked SusC/RagA family outer membrane protein
MRKKILLFKIFLSITFSIVSFALKAQKKTSRPALSDTLTERKDSAAGMVRLPYNQIIPAKLNIASTSAIYHDDMIKAPVTNVLNALTGRIAGLYTQQNSGQPGFDGVSLTLRGRTPIILIDGIPRSLTTMDLEEIESVTVLKDAMATSMLGVRGANGAILITTRKGDIDKQIISFTAQTAFQQPIGMPKPLGAYDYATLRNEAINNEVNVNPNFNTGLRYSAADLLAYQNQTDPFGHPDVNWQNRILKSTAQLDRYSLDISGGNRSVRYFTAVEHLNQDGLFRTSDANKYNTNDYLSGYLIRTNVDINVTPKITAGISVLGSIFNENEPGSTTASIFNSILTTPNNAYPVLNPDGSYAGTTQFVNNIQGQTTGSGYQQNYTRNILADFYAKRSLDEITPGLYLKASLSYTSTLNENINRSKPVVAYQGFLSSTGVQTYGPALTPNSAQINTNSISTTTGVAGLGQYRQNYEELSAGWDRTFNSTHGFDVALLVNSDSKFDGANLPYTVAGISGRATYNYKEKYIFEFAEAYNGSNYYPTSSHYKYGFFPVVGLGWNITKESVMKNYPWLNYLKLSANYGLVGNDNPGYFVYLQRINNSSTPYFGTAAGANTSLAEQTLANPNITYEKAAKFDLRLDGQLVNNHLGFSLDYYNNQFSDLLIQRGQNTSLIGNSYPNENIGKNQYTGLDFQLSWQQSKANGLSYFIAVNGGVQQSKVIYSNEVNQPYSWMQRTGQKVGQAFGYVSAGLFKDQADIINAKQNGVGVIAGYTPQPGDIKYIDQNGDGIINQFDQVPIGPKGPLITYGVDLGFSYKNFDLSVLFQGVANYDVYLNGNSYWEFQNNGYGQAYQQQLDRWTPATASSATYPRLSIGTNSNNETFSSFWFRSADYLRLKNLQIGFTLPGKYANAIKLKSLRLFATGTNLFTLTKLKGGLDPEIYNGAYPMQRLFNLGINLKL